MTGGVELDDAASVRETPGYDVVVLRIVLAHAPRRLDRPRARSSARSTAMPAGEPDLTGGRSDDDRRARHEGPPGFGRREGSHRSRGSNGARRLARRHFRPDPVRCMPHAREATAPRYPRPSSIAATRESPAHPLACLWSLYQIYRLRTGREDQTHASDEHRCKPASEGAPPTREGAFGPSPVRCGEATRPLMWIILAALVRDDSRGGCTWGALPASPSGRTVGTQKPARDRPGSGGDPHLAGGAHGTDVVEEARVTDQRQSARRRSRD